MKPNLIIQMQRIGDLILSFPLALKLLQKEPDTPLWIVAEEHFYSALLQLAPKVVFIPPNASILLKTEFKTLINLSHRRESAKLTGKIKAEKKIGYYEENNELFINGFWQLYRASLTNNSRHNLFHWADLNCLDILSQADMASQQFALPKPIENKGKIGLFLGASSPYKRPDPDFFASLAIKFIHFGYKPVFLGGKNERELGNYINRQTKLHSLNLVDHFNLKELVLFMQDLDFLITSDTGPMHIAAAFSVPTLTLSMGNVNPFETSVANPMHYTLQANMSCTSCWECTRNYQCKQCFTPSKVAVFAKAILQKNQIPQVSQLSFFQTRREDGLHKLKTISSTQTKEEQARFYFSHFWQDYFLRISPNHFEKKILGIDYLSEFIPSFIPYMRKAHLEIFKTLKQNLRKKEKLSKNYWLEQPVYMRQLTNFIQLYLENNIYSFESYNKVFSFLEDMLE